jgi:hypothetical protein
MYGDMCIIYRPFEEYPLRKYTMPVDHENQRMENEYTLFVHKNYWMSLSKLNRVWRKYVRNKNE